VKRLVVLVALLLAGCNGGLASLPTSPPTSTRTIGLLSTRVTLSSRTMVAGSKITGHVIVRNNSGHALTVTGCGSLFQVALSNASVRDGTVWNLCAQELTIPVGISNYPVTFFVSYVGCNQVGPPPLCGKGNRAPLPPGRYQAKLYQHPSVVPTPPPIAVQVTR
jgi:hypothetical protein